MIFAGKNDCLFLQKSLLNYINFLKKNFKVTPSRIDALESSAVQVNTIIKNL